ncbi:MAG: valine--tRNA ligase [Candidatus Nanoarchaeia archaeon]|nr:valine--tRNA ligase [Candidatus Nanoarchaeia archaeon]
MLDKNYNAADVEKKWQDYWEKENIYKFDPNSKKKIYSVDVPPPYASAGHLHVGHALHYTQFEIIARYKRMKGFNVYFAPCFDDNGLPTEKYVEEKLGVNKNTVSRSEFRKLCIEANEEVERIYRDKVFKRLGHSYDWNLLYTTIGNEAQKVAQTSFVKLVKQGDCYRAEEPTIWCTYHQTALAQAEVEDLKRKTKLNYIDFDLENGEKINVATTRPEFLAACVGIFVHPDDVRYEDLVGKNAVVPIFNQKVPIMTDEKVDKDFGTGIVMICTFGDNTDIEWWKKHNLPLKIIIDKRGMLNELALEYKGLTLNDAREKIIEKLTKEGKLKNREELEQTVGSCWRCNTPVEYIVTKQWFIKALNYKNELIEQGRKINWYPEFFRVRYEDWTKNLGWDWCISRQRFFGVPIPAWYCNKCDNIVVAKENELPLDPLEIDRGKCTKCKNGELKADEDVFDTWMTSSMTPQITARWLEDPLNYKKKFPSSLRPQAQDIIRTWAFYTILKSYLHFKEIPWRDISLGTFVLDAKGRGMHKSKGNVVWADILLEKYDVDTFRHWVGKAKWGSDIPFKEEELVNGKKFLTKLWNASKFVLMHLENYDYSKPNKIEDIDKYYLLKLNDIIKTATESYETYDTSEANKAIESYFWHDFCDNYLEIVKDRLYNPNVRGGESRKSAQYTLYKILSNLLKLIAPVVPHITEEIYHVDFAKNEENKSIHTAEWPKEEKIDGKLIIEKGDLFVKIVESVRKIKTDNKKSLKDEIVLTLDNKSLDLLKDLIDDLKAVTKAKEIKKGEFNTEF